MADITKLHDILNWKLLKGAHKFPGPDGGTCINEAAIVAAGFKYRKVQCVDDLPTCFSLAISFLLLALNDDLPDEPRQKLIRFVPKLAGSRLPQATEMARLRYLIGCIGDRLHREVTPRLMPLGSKAADLVRTVPAWIERDAWARVRNHLDEANRLAGDFFDLLGGARHLGGACVTAYNVWPDALDDVLDIIDSALDRGQKEKLDDRLIALAKERLEAAKRNTAETAPA